MSEIVADLAGLEGALIGADKQCPDWGIKPSEAWRLREAVKAKYGLPEIDGIQRDPVTFKDTLIHLAEKEGISVVSDSEFSGSPDKYRAKKVKAVFLGESVFRRPTIVLFDPRDNLEEINEGDDLRALRA